MFFLKSRRFRHYLRSRMVTMLHSHAEVLGSRSQARFYILEFRHPALGTRFHSTNLASIVVSKFFIIIRYLKTSAGEFGRPTKIFIVGELVISLFYHLKQKY